MGIVLKELGEVTLGGQTVRIEYNHGGEIHFEIGSLRLAMTSKEMLRFAKLVRRSRKSLLERKTIEE